MEKNLRIVLWIAGEANQVALANKIHHHFPVLAIVTESRKHKRVITIKKIVEKLFEKAFLRTIGKAWFGMLQHYRNIYHSLPDVALLNVENINSDEVYDFTRSLQPDIIVVSGTRLIRKKLLSIKPDIGILNLHTGLSPYIKGGPNCTNWCIAEKQFHLVGNTIMWIDEGIDTGNIMATEYTSFAGNENLLDLHIKVMDHGHDLFIRCISEIIKGKMNNVPQNSIAKGKTYYTKQWGLKQKIQLMRNVKLFNKVINTNAVKREREKITTISIDNLHGT